MKKIILVTASIVFLMAAMANADTLQIGGNFNSITLDGYMYQGKPITETVGGGSILPSYLNGVQLPYLYCIDLYTEIYVPATYSTLVTNNGTIDGGAAVHNSGKIAWLLDNYAAGLKPIPMRKSLSRRLSGMWSTESLLTPAPTIPARLAIITPISRLSAATLPPSVISTG